MLCLSDEVSQSLWTVKVSDERVLLEEKIKGTGNKEE